MSLLNEALDMIKVSEIGPYKIRVSSSIMITFNHDGYRVCVRLTRIVEEAKKGKEKDDAPIPTKPEDDKALLQVEWSKSRYDLFIDDNISHKEELKFEKTRDEILDLLHLKGR